jgi:hypothetical protein
MATFGRESWTRNKDIDKRLATFDGRVWRRMLGELKQMKIGENDIIKNS